MSRLSQFLMLLITSCPAVICMAVLPSAASGGTEVGLRVSPTRITPVIAAGDTTRETITLQNSSAQEMVVRGRIGGSASSSPDKPVAHLDPEQISLKPGQTSSVTLFIDVPADSEAGENREMLLFDILPPSGREVSIIGQVAVLLDISTIHPVDEVDISIPLLVDSTDSPSIALEGRNSGNFPTQLRGTVTIDRLLGDDLVLTTTSEKIQVGQSAVTYAVWDGSPLMGAGRITATLDSGVGAPVEESSWFIIFPWKLTLVLMLIFVTCIIGARHIPFFAKVFRLNWRKEGNIGQ